MKLLHRTLRVYIIFSSLVLIISTPLFYFLVNKLFIDDADETLLLRKKEFLAYTLPSLKVNDINNLNEFSRDLKIQPAAFPVTNDTLFYRNYLDTLANENEPYRVLLSPITIESNPFVVMTRINLIESEDMIKSIAVSFIIIVTCLLTGLYFITRKLSRKLWKPFYTTLNNIENFELDKNNKPSLPESDIDEFSRLNHSVEKLIDRNIEIYAHQKEFIENAAHELQTPLAVFQAKLDTLAQQLPFTDELSKTLTDLNDSASRLARLNKNLLLLSKIENGQFKATDDVDAYSIIRKLAFFFAEQGEEKNIKVISSDIEPMMLKGNATLFEIVISNLLLNAIRHNHNDGKVILTFHKNCLQITNSSAREALDPEKLFQRFSQPGSGSGNGLGLSIVKKICDLHGWQISYGYENKLHIFQITF
jgi:two-component system sensor histidine kinase ArlS